MGLEPVTFRLTVKCFNHLATQSTTHTLKNLALYDVRLECNVTLESSNRKHWNDTCENKKVSHGAQELAHTVPQVYPAASCFNGMVSTLIAPPIYSKKKCSLEISHGKCPTVQYVSCSKIAAALRSWEISLSRIAISTSPSSKFQICWVYKLPSNVTFHLKSCTVKHHCHFFHLHLW